MATEPDQIKPEEVVAPMPQELTHLPQMLEMVAQDKQAHLLHPHLEQVVCFLVAAAVVVFLVPLVLAVLVGVELALCRQQVVLLEAQILAVVVVAVGGQAPLTRQQAQAALAS